MIMPDEGAKRQNSIKRFCREYTNSANPTIPVDPAGDYLYQGSTKPCEACAARHAVLLSNT